MGSPNFLRDEKICARNLISKSHFRCSVQLLVLNGVIYLTEMTDLTPSSLKKYKDYAIMLGYSML